ncbi:MAG: hypothetical protein HC912_00610 [Saprospiraceae bacterium]|nr:hypothetical protein [Saprospiraceae bacterium]
MGRYLAQLPHQASLQAVEWNDHLSLALQGNHTMALHHPPHHDQSFGRGFFRNARDSNA